MDWQVHCGKVREVPPDGGVIVVIVDGVECFVFVLYFLAQMCEGHFGEKLGRMWMQAHLENLKNLTVSSSVVQCSVLECSLRWSWGVVVK